MSQYLGLFILFLINSEIALATPHQVVKVRAYNRIFDRAQITLADIVETDGLDDKAVQFLEKVQLGDAPSLGEQRVFTNRAIAEVARKESIKKSWILQIPQNVTVDNRGFDLSRDSVEKELLAQWNSLCAECEFKIKNMQLPAIPKKLAEKPWVIESEQRLPRGYYTKKLTLIGEDGRANIFWVNGQLEIRKKVPTLNRSLNMNTRIHEEDVELKWRDITYATDSTPELKDAIGQKIKYTMNANDIIWSQSLVREKAVRRGESVKVSLGEGSWQVTVNAIMEDDGFIGDTVNLRNPQTNRKLTGRVTGQGEVEVR